MNSKIVKNISFAILFLSAIGLAQEDTFYRRYISYGVENFTCGGAFGPERASVNAKKEAEGYCRSAYGLHSQVLDEKITILDSYRQSCWAGMPSGLAVKLQFNCADD